jgi:hypothetical protein
VSQVRNDSSIVNQIHIRDGGDMCLRGNYWKHILNLEGERDRVYQEIEKLENRLAPALGDNQCLRSVLVEFGDKLIE